MRIYIKNLLKELAKYIWFHDPVYEFGSRQIQDFANLRPLFPNKKYVGVDIVEGPGVDLIEDIQYMNINNDSVGSALCIDTLEHVEYPHQTVKEIHRVLKPSGILFLVSVFDFPIHEEPDYWRFTNHSFESIMKDFTSRVSYMVGPTKDRPHTIIGIGVKGVIDYDFSVIDDIISTWICETDFEDWGNYEQDWVYVPKGVKPWKLMEMKEIW